MPPDEKKPSSEITLYLKERKDFYALLGEAISSWSSIETLIYNLFCIALKSKIELSRYIFWNFPTFSMRLSYTTGLIGLILSSGDTEPSKKHKSELAKKWAYLNCQLIEQYKIRNLLAHQPRSEEIMREISDETLGSAKFIFEISKEFTIKPNMHDPKQTFKDIDVRELRNYINTVVYLEYEVQHFTTDFVKARALKYPDTQFEERPNPSSS